MNIEFVGARGGVPFLLFASARLSPIHVIGCLLLGLVGIP